MTSPLTTSDPPTIRDVAKHAGVSVATVSRALKSQPGLTEETRLHVLKVAEELGYNFTRLRPVKLKRIGFFRQTEPFSVSINPFYFPVLHGVEMACRRKGLAFSYSSVGPEDDLEEIARVQEVDALVCTGFMDESIMKSMVRLGKPLVLIDHQHPGVAAVNMDNVTGAYQATQHLIAMGRKRIAFIAGPDHFSVRQRQQGYVQALTDAGRTVDPALMVKRNPIGEQAGAYSAMQHLLALPEPPDAVFAYNDETALVAMQACQDAGLVIPDDMAFVGFDDIPAAAHSHPSLTTVHVDKETLGREAVKLLLQPEHLHDVSVPVRLTIRQSSKTRPRR